MNDRQKTSLREHFQSKAKQFLLQTKEQAFEYSIRPDNGYIRINGQTLIRNAFDIGKEAVKFHTTAERNKWQAWLGQPIRTSTLQITNDEIVAKIAEMCPPDQHFQVTVKTPPEEGAKPIGCPSSPDFDPQTPSKAINNRYIAFTVYIEEYLCRLYIKQRNNIIKKEQANENQR